MPNVAFTIVLDARQGQGGINTGHCSHGVHRRPSSLDSLEEETDDVIDRKLLAD